MRVMESMGEAIDWVKRCPNPMLSDSEIEIRPFFVSVRRAPAFMMMRRIRLLVALRRKACFRRGRPVSNMDLRRECRVAASRP